MNNGLLQDLTLDLSADEVLSSRKRTNLISSIFFRVSNAVAILALALLLLTVIDKTFGIVAVTDKVDRNQIINQPFQSLSKNDLIHIIESNLSTNRIKTLDRQKPLSERTIRDLRGIVENEVFNSTVVSSYSLFTSLFDHQKVLAEINSQFPGAQISFKSWLNWSFLSNSMSNKPEEAGVRTAIFGSFFVVLIAIIVAFPLGVSTAIYLEEFTSKTSILAKVVQTNIDNLAGIPSILYGILGLAIFVRLFEPLTSGRIFGIETANGRTILSAGLTIGLLILPILITNAQESIKAVPNSIKQASYGLGATQWQTIWHHVLPSALPGILTGTILAISRALGETAPLIIVGAATFITKDPSGLFSNFTALPIQIYNWTTRPQTEFRNIAAAAILVLLIMLLSLNAAAILWRNRIYKNN